MSVVIYDASYLVVPYVHHEDLVARKPGTPSRIPVGRRGYAAAMRESDFDGGDREVPGGVSGDLARVVVVGAGVAGLAAANALTHGGVECVVVEARDRIGGRLHTLDLAGWPVDMGGSWIHHPIGNPLSEFADCAGVGRRPGDPVDELVAFDCFDDRRLSAEEWAESMSLQYEQFPEAQRPLVKRLGERASMRDAIESFICQTGLDGSPGRRARQALGAVIEAEGADRCEAQSLRWMWNELEYDGGYFGDLPNGGYGAIVNALAYRVNIGLDTEVQQVELLPSGVEVHTSSGSIDASHVIVTVPLGVLSQGRPRFVPALPQERLQAMDSLGFGRFEKLALAFQHPFWREAGKPHLVLFPPDENEPAVWVLGLDAFGGGPILLAMVFHTSAHRVIDGGGVEWLLGMLKQALGPDIPTPIATASSSWAADPWSCGAYFHIRPGGSPADVDLLGEPIGGRICFAGEHTQSTRLAYADGAFHSGIREAERLLRKPQVRVDTGFDENTVVIHLG